MGKKKLTPSLLLPQIREQEAEQSLRTLLWEVDLNRF